jgi:hypothetical protein
MGSMTDRDDAFYRLRLARGFLKEAEQKFFERIA